MEYVNTSLFQQVLDLVEQMSFEDQTTLTEVLSHRLTEARRTDIARNAAVTLQAIRNREAKRGSMQIWKIDVK